MNRPGPKLVSALWSSGQHRRVVILAALVGLQGVGAAFFVGDVVADFMAIGFDPHTRYEALATLALVLGVVFGVVEMRHALSRQMQSERALRLAAGAFSDMIRDRFAHWALSQAEAEVALLTLKGFDTNEIAALRNTAAGTVRVQLAKVYEKSGQHSRAQFVSSFLDALIETPIAGAGGVEAALR